jgi:hypothetical protein
LLSSCGVSHAVHALLGRALAVLAAWFCLDDSLVPKPSVANVLGWRMLASILVGLIVHEGYHVMLRRLFPAWLQPHASPSSCEVPRVLNTIQLQLNDLWLSLIADRWPAEAGPPPLDAAANRPGTASSAKARGVAIRACKDERKGYGAFAVRPISRGQLVGVYAGERISQRTFFLRHGTPGLGWSGRQQQQPTETVALTVERYTRSLTLTVDERAALDERAERMAALPVEGVGRGPVGGASNCGAYCWELLPTSVTYPEGRVAFIDAEDPERSSWARYINAARMGTQGCNLSRRVNAHQGLVWFVAIRDIAAGEELHYEYGDFD